VVTPPSVPPGTVVWVPPSTPPTIDVTEVTTPPTILAFTEEEEELPPFVAPEHVRKGFRN
jgi:hypothetical protein